MIIYCDIDNTICKTNGNDYENATPMFDKIEKINKLFDEGHEIIFWTARGTTSGIDWSGVTVMQLMDWGVKYTSLKMNKFPYDVFYDDKALTL